MTCSDEHLLALRDACERELAWRGVARRYPATEAMFADGGEVWRVHVLEPLMPRLRLNAMLALRLVSRLWLVMVHCLRVLPPLRYETRWHDDWECFMISHKAVRTLVLDERMLSLSHREESSPSLERLTSLTLRAGCCHAPVGDDFEPLSFGAVNRLTSLTHLSYRTAGQLEGLVALTNLTALEVGGHAFDEPQPPAATVLRRLTALRSLDLWRVCQTGVGSAIGTLRHLTRLVSDRPAHFARYSGHGRLVENHDEGREDDWDENDAYLGSVQLGCHRAEMSGEWRDCRFTGAVDFDCEGPNFKGTLVANEREGHGVERLFEGWEYNGNWHAGQRHGHGCLASYEPSEEEDDGTSEWTLLRHGFWERGVFRAHCVGDLAYEPDGRPVAARCSAPQADPTDLWLL